MGRNGRGHNPYPQRIKQAGGGIKVDIFVTIFMKLLKTISYSPGTRDLCTSLKSGLINQTPPVYLSLMCIRPKSSATPTAPTLFSRIPSKRRVPSAQHTRPVAPRHVPIPPLPAVPGGVLLGALRHPRRRKRRPGHKVPAVELSFSFVNCNSPEGRNSNLQFQLLMM